MKNKFTQKTILVILLCSLSVTSFAQTKEKSNDIRKHVLKTNLLGYLAGQYQLAYEQAITDNVSLQMSAGFLSGGSNTRNYENNRTGFILIPEARYYFSGEAPRRFYIGAFARYRQANNNLTDNNWTSGGTGLDQNLSRTRKVNSIGGGAILGYQAITRGGFTFDIYAGPQYKSRSYNTSYDNNALNAAPTNSGFETVGDELFSEKYTDFKVGEKEGMGLRFGFQFGYAF